MVHHDSSFPSDLPRSFQTTRWSMVLACRNLHQPQGQEALEELCKLYWYPVYAFLRRKGTSRDDAQELTQSFFLKVMQQDFFAKAEPERGRLRSFLLKSVQNHLLSAHRSRAREQRYEVAWIDFDEGESRYQRERRRGETAEQLFERKWALSLLASTLEQLGGEMREKYGELQARAMLEQLNFEQPAARLGLLADEFQIAETTLKARIHRMRKRYRELLRQAVANTLDVAENVDDELRRLRSLIAGHS